MATEAGSERTSLPSYALNGAAHDEERSAPRPSQVGPLPDRIRHRFPIFERKLYINSCSQGALSDSVRASY